MTQKLEKNHSTISVSLHFIFCSDVLLLSCSASQELNLKEQCFANCSAWHDCNMQSIMHNMHPIIPFIIIVSWLRAREWISRRDWASALVAQKLYHSCSYFGLVYYNWYHLVVCSTFWGHGLPNFRGGGRIRIKFQIGPLFGRKARVCLCWIWVVVQWGWCESELSGPLGHQQHLLAAMLCSTLHNSALHFSTSI